MASPAGGQEGRYRDILKYVVLPGVYAPAEDTWLLANYVEELGKRGALLDRAFLEIGCGTGIIAIIAAKYGARVTATDINPSAVKNTKLNAELMKVEVTAFASDLFSNIKGEYDIIAFNPPYLPSEPACPDRAWDGGSDGAEVVCSFIRTALPFLREEGRILLVLSSLTNMDRVFNTASEVGIKFRTLRKKHFFFEELSLLEGRRCH